MIWAVVLAVGAGSYALRAVPLLTGIWRSASPRTERAMGRAATAALTALVVSGATGSGSAVVPAVAAVTAGTVAALRRASMMRVVIVGIAVHLVCSRILTLVA